MSAGKPSFRERMKPLEYVMFGTVAGVFTGLVVLLSTQSWALAGIFALVAFAACLLVVATLLLSVNKDIDKNKLEQAKRAEQNTGSEQDEGDAPRP